jgi:hypothetical protein
VAVFQASSTLLIPAQPASPDAFAFTQGHRLIILGVASSGDSTGCLMC